MAGNRKLDELAAELQRNGGDRQRLALVEQARRFKRAWVEMAEALMRVRGSEAYLAWGYNDIYDYCALELQIKKATVDKLLASYGVLTRHAPEVLDRDGIQKTIPAMDAVDYFAKALRGDPANDANEEPAAPPEVIEDLHRAVFEENKPVAVLRRTFNPILHPKPEGAAELETLQKGHALARKLTHVLPELEGLSEPARERVAEALDILRNELEELIPEARDRIERSRKAS